MAKLLKLGLSLVAAFLLALGFLTLSPLLLAQNVNSRYDNVVWTVAYIGGQQTYVPVPNATIQICSYPANAVPCTNLASLYVGPTILGGTSSNPIQADQYGNFGFWAASGYYSYTVTNPLGQSAGPYPITLGGSGGGGGGGGSLPAGTGIVKVVSGVGALASAGNDYISPNTQNGMNFLGTATPGANFGSNQFTLQGNYCTGASPCNPTSDFLDIQSVPGTNSPNPTMLMVFNHSGSSGGALGLWTFPISVPAGSTAATPAPGDNSTAIATTAFVNANALPSGSGLVKVTSGVGGLATAGGDYLSPNINNGMNPLGNAIIGQNYGSNQFVMQGSYCQGASPCNQIGDFFINSTFPGSNSPNPTMVNLFNHSGSSGGALGLWTYPVSLANGSKASQVDAAFFGAKGDAIAAIGGCSITISTTALGCGGVTFVSGDVGKDFWVPGAGAAGVALHSTIASVTDANDVVLADTALTTATNQIGVYGHDDVSALQNCFNYSAANAIPCVLNSPTGYLVGSGGLIIAVNAPSYNGAMNVQGSTQTKGTNLFCEFNGDCLSLQAGPVQGATLANIALEMDPSQPNGRGIHLNATPAPGSSANSGGMFNGTLDHIQVDLPAQECIWFDGGGGPGYAFNLPNQYINLYNFTCNGPNQLHTASLVLMTGQDAQINFLGGAVNGRDDIALTNYPNPMISIHEKTGGLNDAPEAIEMLGWTCEVGEQCMYISQTTDIHYDNGYMERVGTALNAINSSGFTFNGNHLANAGFNTAVATFGQNTNGSFRDNVIFGNGGFTPLAMAVCTSNNGYVEFSTNSSTTTSTTGCATIQQSPAATFNAVGTTAFMNSSGTTITTINDPNVMPGKTLTLFATGALILGTGGNINLGGNPSPLTLSAGQSVTLTLFDLGPTWLVTSVTGPPSGTALLAGTNTWTGSNYFPFNSSPAVITLGPVGTPSSFTQIYDDGNFHFDASSNTGRYMIFSGNSGGKIARFRTTASGSDLIDFNTDGGIAPVAYEQSAASSTGGTCSMVAGTTCTITLGHTYSTPVCTATEQGTSATVIAAACGVSGTTVTITAASSNSATWGAFVFGNPN